VEIRNAPWEDVLNEIERQTGIIIQVEGRFTGTLTQALDALPLEQGLRQLFRDANVLFFYATGTEGGGTPGRLIRLLLFPKAGNTTEARPIPRSSAETAAVEEQEEPDSTVQTADTTASEAEEKPEHEPVTEDDQDERLTALQRFAEQGTTGALQRAIFDPDQTIQAAALELLVARDRQAAIDALIGATKSDQPAMREQALYLLHQTDLADDRTVMSTLEEALTDEDVAVKSYAIQALGEGGEANAIGALRQALRDPDVTIKKMVIESVAQTEQGRSLLQGALSDDDATIRSLATFWLEEVVSEGK